MALQTETGAVSRDFGDRWMRRRGCVASRPAGTAITPREKPYTVRVQLFPQVVGHAALVVEAVLAAAALRGVQRLLDRADDVRDGYLGRVARELVAAARPRTLSTELAPAQLAEQLLEIRQGDLLRALMPAQRDRSIMSVAARGPASRSRRSVPWWSVSWRSPGKERAGKPDDLVKYRDSDHFSQV
jgi:hypothetical protein